PNKLFDALAAGLPAIVNSAGWTRDLVLDHDAGTYVNVTRPEALADALCVLRDDPALRARQGAHARALAESTFAREKLAAQFCAVLERAVENGTGKKQGVLVKAAATGELAAKAAATRTGGDSDKRPKASTT
ncbi:MAG: hypothetical protein H7123_07380, partial [Thermoleophilia bacterium]|nr:hypothetical protein [Thermoleophilia bacterium]